MSKSKNSNVLDSELMADQRVAMLKDKCNFLYKANKPFTLIKSGSSYELISSMYNDKAYRSGFSSNDLSFIKMVKGYIKRHDVELNFIDEDYRNSGIDYVKVNKFKVGDVLEDLYCVDIDSAYWKTALNLGVISDDIYKKGLDMGKVVRLAALGSLAKKKDIWVYDGKSFKKQETVKSPYENIWFAICKKISDIMNDIVKSIGDDFVFYWVDGIYVKQSPGLIDKIVTKFKDKGYSVHFEYVPKVSFHKDGFTVQGELVSDVKNFSYDIEGQGTKSKPISQYLENQRLIEVANKYVYKK